jgi:hypothetical protein
VRSRSDYQCAGFTPNSITSYILIFWVFLTNVLILNLIIAMMNHTFNRHMDGVASAWLLDVSYRIMRYERQFPELKDRMQTLRVSYSIWKMKFWKQLFWDICLVIYCLPDVHLWGKTHKAWVELVKCSSALRSTDKAAKGMAVDGISPGTWEKIVTKLAERVNKTAKSSIERKAGQNEELKRRASLKADIEDDLRESEEDKPGEKLEAAAMIDGVRREVARWSQLLGHPRGAVAAEAQLVHAQVPTGARCEDAVLFSSSVSTGIEGAFGSGPAIVNTAFVKVPLSEAGAQERAAESPEVPGTPVAEDNTDGASVDNFTEDLEFTLLLVSLIYRLDRLYLGANFSSIIHEVHVNDDPPDGRARQQAF